MSVDERTERGLDRWARWYINTAKTPFTIRSWRWIVVNIAILFAATFLRSFWSNDGGWRGLISGLAAVFIGAWAGVGILTGLTRKQCYRGGWLDGRRAFVESMHEARINGVDEPDFLLTEMMKDSQRLFLQ